jgi:MoaA/NifB/PqqE/SkfB family radical SAM enzyme
MSPFTTDLSPDRASSRTASAFALHAHLDLVERHVGSSALSCITGWIAVEKGHEIVGLGLRLKPELVIRCNYPFFRGDAPEAGQIAGPEALTGFTILLPAHLAFAPESLELVVAIAPDDSEPRAYTVALARETGRTQQITLRTANALPAIPEFAMLSGADVSEVLERRLEDNLARQPYLTLRLDLINKCNLRCVMCYYSDDKISKRPAQRVSPEQFASWFEPLAPLTRDVVLSCGDEPLMSPHFETIIRWLAAKAPDARIIFCTNGMLLSAKNAEAIIASRVYLMLFSFDGATSETLHRIRVGSDYGKIVKNILGLKKLRAAAGGPRPRFVFNFVMMESNIHEAPFFVRMAKRLGGDYVDLRHVVPMLDPRDIAHEMLENHKPKFNFYRERILAAAAECGMEIYIPPAFDIAATHHPAGDPVCSLDEFHALMRDLDEDPLVDSDPPRIAEIAAPARRHEAAHTFCERPFSEVMIQQQRDVYPCPWHQEKMGTLDGTTTLDEIFFGENFRRVRLAMLDPHGAPGCSNCPIKSGKLPTRIL